MKGRCKNRKQRGHRRRARGRRTEELKDLETEVIRSIADAPSDWTVVIGRRELPLHGDLGPTPDTGQVDDEEAFWIGW